MAEEETKEQEQQLPQETSQEEPQGEQEVSHETDWKKEARKWEARSKENAEKLAKLQEQAEQMRANGAKVDELTKELEALKASKAHDEAVLKVSSETGIPANLLKGDNEEELNAFAQSLTSYMEAQKPSYPTDKGAGQNSPRITREQIFAIKNPQERQKVIAENLDLFK